MNGVLDSPLVSVTVITYNSSKFVIETLESIKAQTYKNIELIVSDDCSKDNTVEVVDDWLKKNKIRFVEAKLITTEINTGIPGNKSRAIAVAKGEWLKSIAGDDLLAKDCIKRFVEGLRKDNYNHSLALCNAAYFENNTIKSINIDKLVSSKDFLQLTKYVCQTPTIAPFAFIKKDLINKLGGYDTSYRYLEDLPFFFKALSNNNHFLLIRENLVYYRLSSSSLSTTTQLNETLKQELVRVGEEKLIPYLKTKKLYFNVLKRTYMFTNQNAIIRKLIHKIAKVELNFFCVLYKK